jgi:transposase
MTQRDRDRLVALKKARKGLITQRQAAAELGQSERHVRRLLKRLKGKGDGALVHALRGRESNRKLEEKTKQKALEILGREVYRGFGPTLAAEYLASKHDIHAGRETVRGWMLEGKLWHASRQRIDKIHQWRPRRSRVGELVQWDTSEHAWLEGRGPKLYLISMIDDASSRIHARFVLHDSTEENMRLVWSYVERYGRPVSYYTDKAALFQTAPKVARNVTELPRDERDPLPPTQIGRALRELDIVWIGAHSPQAKGRVERGFQTAQDRLVKGLRVAGAKTLEQANAYLEAEFIPWWNSTITVVPASRDDAHRPLGKEHSLAASLSYVETRQVSNDYTIQVDRQTWQIAPGSIRAGLRGADVRVEMRLDRSMAVRFREALPGDEPMPTASQSTQSVRRRGAEGYCATRQEPMDGELPPNQSRKNRSFRKRGVPAGLRQETNSVGRATTARPASRLLYSKPPLGSSTKVSWSPKAKPSEGTPQGPVNRGLAAVYFGANSVASALNLPQERDLPKNHHHSKPHLPNRTPKPDISTWQRIGHFYLALTTGTCPRYSTW